MNKILVVDDDINIRELVSTLLQNEGYATCSAADGREAFRMLSGEKVDLCILDVMMPNLDGYEFCKMARNYYDFPILMLTARGETAQKVKGFELGADDYLTKPFEAAELLARVKALLKRYHVTAAQTLQIGAVTVDRDRYGVIVNGKVEDIPMKEFELLYTLGSGMGRTFSRDQLIEEVWGYDFEGNERTLDVHINRLRERFTEEEHRFKIVTIRGLGYRLEVIL